MNEYNEYSEQLERYEQVAYEGGYGAACLRTYRLVMMIWQLLWTNISV